MKSIAEGFFTALALYSVLPVPIGQWSKRNMRYTLCFFPLVGVAMGVILLLWYEVCVRFSVHAGLFAVFATLLPEIISGGTHMNGFIHTVDALACHGLAEQKQDILKDTHAGISGIMLCAGLFLLRFGLWCQLYQTPYLLVLPAVGYSISRALSALSIVFISPAKQSGVVYLLSEAAAKKASCITGFFYLVFFLGAVIWVYPVWGIVAFAACLAFLGYYKRFCRWEFGGNAEGPAGFFVQTAELLFLFIAVIGGLWP